MPDGRTELYAIYNACERFGILPPNVKPRWDDNETEDKANLLVYSQIRNLEHTEEVSATIAANYGRIGV